MEERPQLADWPALGDGARLVVGNLRTQPSAQLVSAGRLREIVLQPQPRPATVLLQVPV